jgi:hypothetical protein
MTTATQETKTFTANSVEAVQRIAAKWMMENRPEGNFQNLSVRAKFRTIRKSLTITWDKPTQ